MGVEGFCHCGINIVDEFLILLIAAYDVAFRVKQDYAWDARYAIDVGGNGLCIYNLFPRQLVLFDGFQGVGGFIPNSNAKYFESFVGVFIVKFLYHLGFADTWTAPACSEIHEGVFAFTYVVAEFLRFAVVGNGKILEFVSNGCLFFVNQCLA